MLTNGIKVAKQDTVAFTELASLYIKAMDVDSVETELDDAKQTKDIYIYFRKYSQRRMSQKEND